MRKAAGRMHPSNLWLKQYRSQSYNCCNYSNFCSSNFHKINSACIMFYIRLICKFYIFFQSGFDVLHSLIPSLNQTPSGKVSKAAMLQKGQLLLFCMLASSVLGSGRKSKMCELIYCRQLVWLISIIFIYLFSSFYRWGVVTIGCAHSLSWVL